jgi:hypothetical protein
MTYSGWEPRHRVTTISPGKLDLFVVTLVEGKRVCIDTVMDYEVALARAQAFHSNHPCQIKVLPLTGGETCNMLGIRRPDHPEPMNTEIRKLLIDRLTHIVRESNDSDARRDGFDLLIDMGAFAS